MIATEPKLLTRENLNPDWFVVPIKIVMTDKDGAVLIHAETGQRISFAGCAVASFHVGIDPNDLTYGHVKVQLDTVPIEVK